MFRLLGLLGGLAMMTDLGTGAPLDESLRRSLVAVRLARLAGCPEPEVRDVLYTSLLQHLGCTAYASDAARIWGDDVAATRIAFRTDFANAADLWRVWVPGLAEVTGRSRLRVAATTLAAGRRAEAEGPPATCDVARTASRRLRLPVGVQDGLAHSFAAWDGRGYPATVGTAIPRPTRLMQVAGVAVMAGSPEEAVDAARHSAGRQLDPELCDLLADTAASVLSGLDEVDAYTEVLAAEPLPALQVPEDELTGVAQTFGDLVDLKSVWLHGHSTAVADLASTAVEALSLGGDRERVRVAGHLHDLGRAGVSSRIWDKRGPLSLSERDQARLHPHHSERILARVPALAEVAVGAGQHHERCDGSGYHRGATAAALSLPSRVLAAADAYRSLVEDRPHRPAAPPSSAGRRLQEEARTGRLDPDAVAAVCAAAGVGRDVGRTAPADLTPRQLQVLRLLAGGLSNPGIADRLGISRRTAEHHVQDVYLKIGVASRAGAAMFAMEHGLLTRSG